MCDRPGRQVAIGLLVVRHCIALRLYEGTVIVSEPSAPVRDHLLLLLLSDSTHEPPRSTGYLLDCHDNLPPGLLVRRGYRQSPSLSALRPLIPLSSSPALGPTQLRAAGHTYRQAHTYIERPGT